MKKGGFRTVKATVIKMKEYYLYNMKILDGTADMTPVTGKAIRVMNGRIHSVIPAEEIPEGAAKEDLGGGYLLPGLINLHIHTPTSGKPSKKKLNYAALAKLLRLAPVRAVLRYLSGKNVRQQLLSGTTTVRCVGGLFDFDSYHRDRINAGRERGPRMLVSNYAVSVPGGHMTGSVALPVTTPEEARQMVRGLAQTKPDLIKLMITGGVLDADVPGEPGILKMPPEIAAAAADEAHKLGLPVAAHVEGTEGMRVALDAGIDTVEHGGKPTPELIAEMKRCGTVLTATLSPAVPFALIETGYMGLTETDLLNGKAMFSNMIECIGACLKAGVPVGLGTDTGCPFITHTDTWRELWYFCRYLGVTPTFALHTATALNAKIVGIDGETGTVEVGKSADFMVVREDPTASLSALETLRAPTAVVFRGEMIRKPKPKKYAFVEEQLDQILKR